ncbi:MAG: hypothetical protein M3014_02060 [Chloroflexota bacterium]|nr:hypothetical protein [Chloroflexota bacterium]
MEIILIIVMLLVLGIVAARWGVDSREGPDSLEWERRRDWWVSNRTHVG